MFEYKYYDKTERIYIYVYRLKVMFVYRLTNVFFLHIYLHLNVKKFHYFSVPDIVVVVAVVVVWVFELIGFFANTTQISFLKTRWL